jgi:hypothetical protein
MDDGQDSVQAELGQEHQRIRWMIFAQVTLKNHNFCRPLS